MRRAALSVVVVVGLLVVSPRDVRAYSVLAHEAAIDAVWDTAIRPLLIKRFGHVSQATLNHARSYAYGGSVIQDLGYYPFGQKFFSNLLHYVRSGDFVEALLLDARDINEYAFALGALAHYANDNTGHPEATNKAVPLIFPKLAKKFGETVTYVQAPKEHVIIEFSFDVVHTAGGAYLPEAYRSFIGFRVASGLLERAFHETYGLAMDDLFADQERAIATYRYAVSQIVPALTEAAWREKRDEIEKLSPNLQRGQFVFQYGRRSYEHDYGTNYQKPALFARFLGFLYRLVPKIGPLKPLGFKALTPEVLALFEQSFDDAARRYGTLLRDVADNRFDLRNTDYDTGKPARHGEYSLADETYRELLDKLDDRSYRDMPPRLRGNVLAFYGPRPTPQSRDERKHWPAVHRALTSLARVQTTDGSAGTSR
jgi:Zinc dependent phospholipase C